MKKIFLTLTVLTAMGVGCASAQVTWGLRVGASKPTLAESLNSGNGISSEINYFVDEWGLEAGPTLYCELNDVWYIHSGAMFSIKSFNYVGKKNFRSNWIEIPLYIGSVIPIGNVRTYFQAGPYAGYKLSESFPGSDDSEFFKFKSFNAGLGIMYGVNIKKIKIEAGYQHGLTSLRNRTGENDAILKIRLRSLFAGVSYVF